MKMYEMKGVKGKVLDYQLNFLNLCLNCDNIILNGCRNSSKTFLLAKAIECNYCSNVVFVGDYVGQFEYFIQKMDLHTNYKLVDYQKDKGVASFRDTRVKEMDVLLNFYDYYKCKEINKDIGYDCILFEDRLPFNTNLISKKNISTICYNNSDEWLQRFYPNFTIYQIDYKTIINKGLLKEELLEQEEKNLTKEENKIKFYNEYAILDKYKFK